MMVAPVMVAAVEAVAAAVPMEMAAPRDETDKSEAGHGHIA